MATKSTAINKRSKASVAIIGLGRVGLPLALFLADKENFVFGIDVDHQKIETLNKRKMPFMEEGAALLLEKNLGNLFQPTTDFSVVSKVETIILTLGTPVDDNMNPSLIQIDQALQTILKFLKKDQLLILRSTVSPGTTDYVRSILADNGYTCGKNFFLAFCPERIAEGKSISELSEIPQIIGGTDSRSTKKAQIFFDNLGIKTHTSDAISAELAKLFTNMYRYINFAIANEFMILAGNYHRDIYKIVDLVNRDYKRGGLSLPGLTSGPCLFKDGFFLVENVPFSDLITTSWKINESIPVFLIKKIRERVRLNGKKAVIVGLAFKKEIDDIRESLSFKVKKVLERERAKVFLHDPYIKEYNGDIKTILKDADVVFIATNHDFYKSLNLSEIKELVSKDCIICDIWNIFQTNKIIFSASSI